jgi:hypothetical protein
VRAAHQVNQVRLYKVAPSRTIITGRLPVFGTLIRIRTAATGSSPSSGATAVVAAAPSASKAGL